MEIRAVVITVSDKGYAGLREDTSGPALAEALRALGASIVGQAMVPDEREQIATLLRQHACSGVVDLIVTTGGTGAAPRDVTPEATREVIEREMPGLAELLRWEGYKKTPLAVLSRGIAGLCGRCLIVNLPGSPRAVREGMETLAGVLPHAVQMARGENLEHKGEAHGSA
jgi:molybdenum cofactor synthesis domain-containing protein